MKRIDCIYKTALFVLVLDLTFLYVRCSLVNNVNKAIIANFHDEIGTGDSSKADVEIFVKLFTEYHKGHNFTETDSLSKACLEPSNISVCRQHLLENCLNVDGLLRYSLNESENHTLSDWFPSLLYNLHSQPCQGIEHLPDEHGRVRTKPSSAQAWGYGIGFVTLICCVSNVGGFMAPFMKTAFFQKLLLFCVALAVGTLAATGFLVLIPESMHLTTDDSPIPDYHHKMATVMGGVYFFYVSERLLKIWFSRPKKSKNSKQEVTKENTTEQNNHGHSHVPDFIETVDLIDETTKLPVDEAETPKKVKRKRKLTTVALMILIGDALHNFVDGIAIGAAFTENTYLGISVSLSVVCEELPHELGDIAILLHTGLNMRKSLCYNFLAALTCYIGLVLGIFLGENTDANTWIFAVAGGMFVYISLVDMVPEMAAQMKHVEDSGFENKWTILLIQNFGLLFGFAIIMILVLFGGNIEV